MSKAKKFIKQYGEKLEKKAPKGVDPKKHERCVREVKQQGYNVGSAHAICTSSMKKADTVKMPMKEFVKEHKKLIQVLNSPSHKDDKKEAKKQKKELEDHTKKSDYSTANVGCGSGLAGKICRHNKKKLHSYSEIKKTAPKGVDKEKYDRCVQQVKRKRSAKNAYAVCSASLQGEVNKSVDFQQTKTAIDSNDQLLAEKTTSPELIKYIKTSLENDITKIPFAKGSLTLSLKEPGLYNGFFQDNQGQVVEKFDSMTPEIVAKNMELKSLYERPSDPVAPSHAAVEEAEDRAIAQQEASKIAQLALEAHNAVYHQGQQPGEPIGSKRGYLRIKMGDFEVELRKSVREFAQQFAKSKTALREIDHDLVKKAVESWRRQHKEVLDIPNLQSAAKEIFDNWEQHHESFGQVVYALQQIEKDDE